MTQTMLDAALNYHAESLCVIPCKARDKKPALDAWEEYHTRCSTEAEIRQWFGNGSNLNIGIVHGAVSGNYATVDIDHDSGLFEAMRHLFPDLFIGRLEQSGSGQGYHIPLRLDTLPDLGWDSRHQRTKGNKTWKTKLGDCNLRVSWCQTVAPPSIHPSGNPYRFIQEGPILHLPGLDDLISWLNQLALPPASEALPPTPKRSIRPAEADDLITAVRSAWTAIAIFEYFGLVRERRTESNGEVRLLGNGGLLVAEDDTWYSFREEEGGGPIEAWLFCRFGNTEKRGRFRQALLEMAQAAGIDTAQFYRRGDERITGILHGNNLPWTQKYPMWEKMRA